jgi:hypothetical protein
MAKKSRERVLFEAEIKGLRSEAEGHQAESDISTDLAQAATQKADLIQGLLDQAEEELKKQGAARVEAEEEEAVEEEPEDEEPF